MGDAAGIGPEATLKAITSPEVEALCSPLIIGAASIFQQLLSSLKINLPLRAFRNFNEVNWEAEEIKVLEIEEIPSSPPLPGKIYPPWSRVAMNSVVKGVRLALQGKVAALVTAPINKEGIHQAGYRFQGHTDFLAHLTGTDDYAMMLIGGSIRVVLVTVHVPLSQVSSLLDSGDIARKIRLAHKAMLKLKIAEPKIAVAGLNPHAGEAGAFGREEIEIIKPAVALCRGEGINVEGPLPPDTLFYKLHHGYYDVAVTMYHDQGLIPLKMLAFETGVNVTLGIPIVRTSPDHGTAYDIAGKGMADPKSMIEAIKLACQLAERS